MNITVSLNGFYASYFFHTMVLPKNLWEESNMKKIKKTAALLMCMMMALSLLSGCAGTSEESSRSSEKATKENVSTGAKEEGKKDGAYRF